MQAENTPLVDDCQNHRGTGGSIFARWYFSLLMLAVYLAVFLVWKHYPSRMSFLLVGMLASGGLTLAMIVASRRGYFANRTDAVLHGLVILDLVLETWLYEAYVAVVYFLGVLPTTADANAALSSFHNHYSFLGCALAFTLIIGLHRAWALWKHHVAEFPNIQPATRFN